MGTLLALPLLRHRTAVRLTRSVGQVRGRSECMLVVHSEVTRQKFLYICKEADQAIVIVAVSETVGV